MLYPDAVYDGAMAEPDVIESAVSGGDTAYVRLAGTGW